ncbi:MAG: glycosyltransferase [Polyangiaceae bacterium]
MKTRILYLTNRFAPAGAETFLYNRIRVLDRSRYEPFAGALRPNGELAAAFEREGVPTIEFGADRQLDARGLARLFAFLRREKITILEAHVWWSCVVARVVGAAARVPIIITNEQDMRVGETAHRKDVLFAGDVTTRLSDACVHITHATLQSFRDTTPALLQRGVLRRMIPNGIDARRVAEAAAKTDRAAKRASLGVPESAVVIGNVGRLADQKGQEYLIRAMPQVIAKEPRAHLVIVGWGPLEAELRALTRQLGIEDRVTFAGKRLDVDELLGTFDVFAFSSVHEGQGIAILEAMAASLPLVATAVDGIPDMVKHEETGLLVPSRDPAALASAILRLREDRALAERTTAAAKKLVLDRFSIEAAAQAYDDLYEELLAKKGLASR